MKPYYQDSHNTLYHSDFLDNDLPDESVQMVVTSPPYWDLRKYEGDQDMIWPDGWNGAYGLETTPEMYVQHTVEILREIRRVLRKDGVVFWNCGDSYSASGGAGGDYNKGGLKEGQPKYKQGKGKSSINLKPKDLCLIPSRVAIAAQEDGWWVRSMIIWNKPNPMPESVTDRPSESHEYILMLTKSARYYWNAEAVREKQNGNAHSRGDRPGDEAYQNKRGSYKGFDSKESVLPAGRNIRSVWTFPTQPSPSQFVQGKQIDHFAIYPEKLPETCIKAASKEGDTVLDPFQGAGTTLWVAKKLNRIGIGFDISEEYCRLTVDRIRQQGLL